MSRPSHTPGPWQACIQDAESGEKWYDIWTAHGSVAHVAEYARPDENQRTIHADARLIAAAPEMLEALKVCRQALIESPSSIPYAAEIGRATDAIAKAEGK